MNPVWCICINVCNVSKYHIWNRHMQTFIWIYAFFSTYSNIHLEAQLLFNLFELVRFRTYLDAWFAQHVWTYMFQNIFGFMHVNGVCAFCNISTLCVLKHVCISASRRWPKQTSLAPATSRIVPPPARHRHWSHQNSTFNSKAIASWSSRLNRNSVDRKPLTLTVDRKPPTIKVDRKPPTTKVN